MNLATLALRNLARHRRRSLVTGLAIGFGTLAVVVLQGFVNNFVAHLEESSVLTQSGAVQVYRRGYLGASDPLEFAFADEPNLVARIRSVPGVTAVAPRLAFDGLVSNGSDATMFVATGIDPVAEYLVCPWRKRRIASGSAPVGPEHARGAVVGKALADALGSGLGSTLVLQAAGAHAATNALDVTVQGFLPPVADPKDSRRTVTVPLAFAQDLLRMQGQVTQYAVAVERLEDVERVAGEIRARLGDAWQVTTWREVDPSTRERTQFLRFILVFIGIVLMLLVATGILNTMMMSVYERVREIGTMLAVGVRRRQVTALFLWEASWLGLASALAGVVIGRGLVFAIALADIQWRAPGGEVMALRPAVGVGFLALVVACGALGTALSGIFPAWKASRLRPVEALRSN